MSRAGGRFSLLAHVCCLFPTVCEALPCWVDACMVALSITCVCHIQERWHHLMSRCSHTILGGDLCGEEGRSRVMRCWRRREVHGGSIWYVILRK